MRDFLKFVLWVVAGLTLVGGVLYLTVFDSMLVPSDDATAAASLEPTLSGGDRIMTFQKGTLKAGYLVRCADPATPGLFVIGRIAGVGGDAVELSGPALTVNGKHVSSPRACDTPKVTMRHPITENEMTLACAIQETAGTEHEVLSNPESHEKLNTEVPSGMVFLVSDNRSLHVDSREYGPIDPVSCQHVVFRLWGAGGYFDTRRRFKLVW